MSDADNQEPPAIYYRVLDEEKLNMDTDDLNMSEGSFEINDDELHIPAPPPPPPPPLRPTMIQTPMPNMRASSSVRGTVAAAAAAVGEKDSANAAAGATPTVAASTSSATLKNRLHTDYMQSVDEMCEPVDTNVMTESFFRNMVVLNKYLEQNPWFAKKFNLQKRMIPSRFAYLETPHWESKKPPPYKNPKGVGRGLLKQSKDYISREQTDDDENPLSDDSKSETLAALTPR